MNCASANQPEQHLKSTSHRQQLGAQVVAYLCPTFGVRLTTTSQLHKLAGGKRKRQAHTSGPSVRAVFALLDLDGETIYSKHGNHSTTIDATNPSRAGVMQHDVFARLHADDVVVIVDQRSDNGTALLEGVIDLPYVEVTEFVSAVHEWAIARLGNARDVQAVITWSIAGSS